MLAGELRGSAYLLALAPADAADSSKRVEWLSAEDGREVRYTTEPGASLWRRFTASFLSMLPIESQL